MLQASQLIPTNPTNPKAQQASLPSESKGVLMTPIPLREKQRYIQSFLEFLKTGRLGTFNLGVSRSEAIFLLGNPEGENEDMLYYPGPCDVWLKSDKAKWVSAKFPAFPYDSECPWHVPSQGLIGLMKRINIDWYPVIGLLLTQSQFLNLLTKQQLAVNKYEGEQIFKVVQSNVIIWFDKRRIYKLYVGDPFSSDVWQPWPT
jgi:hypothetical protein